MSYSNLSYVLTRWSLVDLFPSPEGPEMKAAFTEVEAKVAELDGKRSLLTPDIDQETFMDFVRLGEQITRLIYRIYAFAGLWLSEDTQNQAAQNLQARVDQFVTGIENRARFFSLWWKGLDDANAARLIDVAGDYKHWLEEMRHFARYTLSEEKEKIINIKNAFGFESMKTLYLIITNKLAFALESDDELDMVSRDELTTHTRSRSSSVRRAVYNELFNVYSREATVLAQIYTNIVRDWYTEQVHLRHFNSPISARNLSSDIPDNVVNTLLKVVEENVSVFYPFFAMKAKWLGQTRLSRYDLHIYSPFGYSGKKYHYRDAVELVSETFETFSPLLGKHARKVFAENHIDSELRPDKRYGAFCYSVLPDITPFVFMNYRGFIGDVITLASMLGHATHSMLASQHSQYTFHASLPMATLASCFSELLMMNTLLVKENDKTAIIDMLTTALDDAYATIVRQAFITLFEIDAYESIIDGGSIEDINRIYLNSLKRQFGDIVEIPSDFMWEWLTIPHIFEVPFYCYNYAFGYLLALSLFQQYREQGESFKVKYIKILSYGSSACPTQILSEIGIDINSPDFWRNGFKVLEEMVNNLNSFSYSNLD